MMTLSYASDAQIAAFQRVIEDRDYVNSNQKKYVSRITIIKMAINVMTDRESAESFHMADLLENASVGTRVNAFMERAVELGGIKDEFLFCYKPVTEDGMNSVLVWLGQQPKHSAASERGLSETPAPATVNAELEDGIYRRPSDGEIFKVYHTQKGHQVAKRLVVLSDSVDEAKTAEFQYEGKRPLKTITSDMRMTLEEARKYGAVYGVCCCCSRTLTDELSIYLGIGPVCGQREFGETFKFQLAEARKEIKE